MRKSNCMTASWIIDQLFLQGVDHFCTAPGSRNTPLILATLTKNAHVHVHFDERGLGFFALGIAKATKKPVAVIVTSGTAVGNLLPAIMEAKYSFTPLIILTADRPKELIDSGANQVADQVKIFSSFVKWQFDLHEFAKEESTRSIAAQGYFYSLENEPGPIHINCSFSEPLYQRHQNVHEGKKIDFFFPEKKAAPLKTEKSKGVILIGNLPKKEDIHPILQMGKRLKWPIFADILSNARLLKADELIHHFEDHEYPASEIVLHFGERFTSKKIYAWLKKTKPEYVHISPYPSLQDPERISNIKILSDIEPFCASFQAKTDPFWLNQFRKNPPILTDLYQNKLKNREYGKEAPRFSSKLAGAEAVKLKKFNDAGGAKSGGCPTPPETDSSACFGIEMTEIKAMKILSTLKIQHSIFLGNGMPIRDADRFLKPETAKGFFANRGVSGIDGNIATIAGLAEEGPVIGIIGDQAALYDLNSLPLLKKAKHPCILIIFNNFGGGIFHHLPISEHKDFEKYWAMNHDLEFEKGASMFDLSYFPFENLNEALQLKCAVVELKTNRKLNLRAHQCIKQS